MLRALITGLALLHLGPGLAFVLLAFGCDAASGHLATLCAGSTVGSFAGLTAGAWLILGVGGLALHLVRRARSALPPRATARAAALLALLAAGGLVAAAGTWLTGWQAWLLAIPAAVAGGWLYLANPQACLQHAGPRGGPGGA